MIWHLRGGVWLAEPTDLRRAALELAEDKWYPRLPLRRVLPDRRETIDGGVQAWRRL